MSHAILLTIVAILLAFWGWNLELRRRELLRFLALPPVQRVTFDEVVWGVPHARLPERPWMLWWAVVLLLMGGIGAVALGLGLVVFVRVAPMLVFPTMLFAYAARSGWLALGSQAGRVPVVRRLRLTQPHVVVDEIETGPRLSEERVEHAPTGSRCRTIPWTDVTCVDVDDAKCLVVRVRGRSDAVFGPLPDEVADDIMGHIERRRAREVPGDGEVVDLARARLRALQHRADPDGKP